MAQEMISYQNETEAQSHLEGALQMKKMLNNLTNQNLNSQLNQDFFQDDNSTNNKKAAWKNQNHTVTPKLRQDILYRRYKESDF